MSLASTYPSSSGFEKGSLRNGCHPPAERLEVQPVGVDGEMAADPLHASDHLTPMWTSDQMLAAPVRCRLKSGRNCWFWSFV
jgi:hypothetical protein